MSKPATIRAGRGKGYSSLKAADIRSVTLCSSHVPGCVELFISHRERWNRSLSIDGRLRASRTGISFVVTKMMPSTSVEIVMELNFRNLPPAICDLLREGLHYSHTNKETETIIFVPYPTTDSEFEQVGKVIATTTP